MKIAILFMSLIAIVISRRQCIYDDSGLCISECPPGTFSYMPACGEEAYTQATCEQPTRQPMGQVCDLSRCDCFDELVWDELRGACVLYEHCSHGVQTDGPCDGRRR